MGTAGLKEIKNHPLVATFIRKADEHTAAIGYTEHGYRHAGLVSNIAHNILSHLGFTEREAELAGIAGYVHDIGNVVSRNHHGQSGALIMSKLLVDMGMDPEEIAVIIGAVGNHEEESGQAVNNVSAALILADKSDVHRSRVRNTDVATFDIHDRVSYAVEHSFLRVDSQEKTITLELDTDTKICPVMDYFEIFLTRMVMCRRAAEVLGCRFKLEINGVKLL